ncbi:YceI family protein [bacterium]|nr:YceI family protein [bacterium]
MKSFAQLTLAALVGLSVSTLAVDTYKIDASHSTVQFSVKHMVLSNTRGNFGAYDGDIKWDKDPKNCSISGSVKAESVDTRDTKRDEHLRSADFFDTAKFPEITLVSKSIKRDRKGYILTADLTMKGVTKTVTLPLTVSEPVKDPWGNQRVNFSTQFKLNRQDYGMTWNKALDNGGLVVGNDVTVDLDIEGVKTN